MAENLYTFTEADRKELHRLRHKLDTISGPGVSNRADNITINPPTGPAGSAPSTPFKVLYGKVSTAWIPGNRYLMVTPCAASGTVSGAPAAVAVYLNGLSQPAFVATNQPANESFPVQMDAQVGAILMYVAFGGFNYLLIPPSPTVQAAGTGPAQWMVFQLSGAQGPAIFDYPRISP